LENAEDGLLLRLKLLFLNGHPQRHSKHFPARFISDNDLIAENLTRTLVPGKVLGHTDRLLHGIHKGRQILALDIRNGCPASEAEVERWHARHPCTANLSNKTPFQQNCRSVQRSLRGAKNCLSAAADRAVALASGLFELETVNDLNATAMVSDQAGLLELTRDAQETPPQ
jgi:hypothetical protein